jgi:hypothetical protein
MIPWLGPQPEADLTEAADNQFLIEDPDFDLNIDAVFSGQSWHRCGSHVVRPHRRRPERILDPPGGHGEVAGPARVLGHHGKTACQFQRWLDLGFCGFVPGGGTPR